MSAPAGESWKTENGVEETPTKDIVLVSAPAAKTDDGFVSTKPNTTEPQNSPTLAAFFAPMSSRQSSPLSAPPKPLPQPQANMGGGGGGVRSGASTPNAGGGGGGPTGGGGGPGMVNANTFLGYSFGAASNVDAVDSVVGRASQPAPSSPNAFDMPYTMPPPTPSLLPYNPMTAAAPQEASGVASAPRGPHGSDPMYVLDLNTGETIPANVTLNTFSTWSENLLAQVSGATVSSYSWNLSQAPDLTNVSGTTTANLKGTWTNFSGTTRTDTISVTETPTVGQAITVTMAFAVAGTNSPAYSSTQPTSSATWPTVITPDQIGSGQAVQAAGSYAGIGLADGSVQTSFSMPSYNPNTTPVSLDYNSTTANAQPIFLSEYQLPLGQSVPSTITAQLTFNNTALAAVSYSTSGLNPGDIMQIALQANAAGLSTNRYPWSIAVTDGSNKTTYSGSVDIVNQANSPYGAGWSLDNVEQLVPVSTSGVILVQPGGTSLWFASNGSGGFTTPPGDFSTLTLSNGIYTQTLTDGTQINFNSSGQEISSVDTDGNTTSFSYNSSGLLTTITDMNNQVTTLAYNSSNQLASITDPANRTATLTYSGNQLTSIDDPGGDLWQYSYNSANEMTGLTDPNNHTTTFTYDTADRVSSITQPDGTTEQLTPMQMNGYAAAGSSNVTAVLLATGDRALFTDANDNVWTTGLDWLGFGVDVADIDPLGDASLNYINANGLVWMASDALSRPTVDFFDGKGNITEEVAPDDTTQQYQYNSFGEVTQYTNQDDDTTKYTYNSKGDLTQESDALNDITTYAYNPAGLVTSTTDPNGNITTYAYNTLNELTSTTNALGGVNTYSYDNAGDLISTTNPLGYVTTYSYNALGLMTGETLPDSKTVFSTYTYSYDKVGNMVSSTDPLDHTSSYSYNAVNELVSTTDPLGDKTTYGYDKVGNLVSDTNPLGDATTYSYNAANEQVSMTDPLGNQTTYGYDRAGELTSVTDPMGIVTEYAYNLRGEVSSTSLGNDSSGGGGIQPQFVAKLGLVSSYAYFGCGCPQSETIYPMSSGGGALPMVGSGPSGGETDSVTRDALDRIVSSTDALGNTTSYSYDKDGNLISETDPNGNTTSYAYNALNNVVGETNALNQTTTYSYDAVGDLSSETDPLGNVTSYTYDAQSRVLTETAANGGVTTYTYDLAGNLSSIEDPDGNITSYSYNAANELVSSTNPLGYQTTYAYNAAGLLTSTTDPDGHTIDYGYNADGEETSDSWVGGSYTASYAYNADGQMTSASDPFSTYTYTYNQYGYLASTSNSGTPGVPTVTLSYAYDGYFNVSSVSDSLGGSLSYAYNADNEMTGLSLSVNAALDAQLGFSYDGDGNVTGLTRTDPSVSGAHTITTSYSYDKANELTNILDTDTTASTTLANYTYSYNAGGELTNYQDNSGNSLSYSYDKVGELTGASGTLLSQSYAFNYNYDANGNRTSTSTDINGSLTSATYSTGTGNELLSDGTYSYTYDKDGNTLTQTNIDTGAVTYFTWDYENRLTEVEEKSSTGTVIYDEKYTYDVNGNRIGVSLNGSQQLYTVYNGSNPYMDFNGSGTLTERYLTNPQALSQFYGQVSASGATEWFLTDNINSIREVVSSSGSVLDAITYDPYGDILNQTNSANAPRFLYAGGAYDSNAGNDQFDARPYSPADGRFETQDPLSFAAGDPNLYRYVLNSPTYEIDPSGLQLSLTHPSSQSILAEVGITCGKATGAVGGGIVVGQVITQGINAPPIAPPMPPKPPPVSLPPAEVARVIGMMVGATVGQLFGNVLHSTHEKHGRGSEHSSAYQARQRSRDRSLRRSNDRREGIQAQAEEEWKAIPEPAKKLLDKAKWLAKRLKELRGEQ